MFWEISGENGLAFYENGLYLDGVHARYDEEEAWSAWQNTNLKLQATLSSGGPT